MEYLQYPLINTGITFMIVSFKPYYKWNTFNTFMEYSGQDAGYIVLNLIINGIPSIP